MQIERDPDSHRSNNDRRRDNCLVRWAKDIHRRLANFNNRQIQYSQLLKQLETMRFIDGQWRLTNSSHTSSVRFRERGNKQSSSNYSINRFAKKSSDKTHISRDRPADLESIEHPGACSQYIGRLESNWPLGVGLWAQVLR